MIRSSPGGTRIVGEMVRRSVDDSDSLISSGLIDSLSILKLIGKSRTGFPFECLRRSFSRMISRA